MAAALLAYDATVTTDRRERLAIAAALGDGTNGAADNALASGELISAILLAPPVLGERALYKRAISRTHAEWPLAELVLRIVIADGVVTFVRMAAGGIAPVPLRLVASEAVLQGQAVNATTIALAATAATVDANPLPMTRYKLDLLTGLMQDLLAQCAV